MLGTTTQPLGPRKAPGCRGGGKMDSPGSLVPPVGSTVSRVGPLPGARALGEAPRELRFFAVSQRTGRLWSFERCANPGPAPDLGGETCPRPPLLLRAVAHTAPSAAGRSCREPPAALRAVQDCPSRLCLNPRVIGYFLPESYLFSLPKGSSPAPAHGHH